MTVDNRLIPVIRSKSFSIFAVIPLSGFSAFFIQPLRNIHMGFRSRKITEKSQNQVFSFFFPPCNLIFLFDRCPGIDPFLRFQFSPGDIYIQKRNILCDFFVPCIFRIAHQRIPEYRLRFPIFFYKFSSLCSKHSSSHCQYCCPDNGCQQQNCFFSHDILRYTGSA